MKKIILLVILFILVYIVPLNIRPMVIPDETRYAEISREIVETGDWVVPRLNGLRYFEKPILGYWLNSMSIKLIGENAFAIRLPSALAVGISATILFFLVHRFTNDITTAIIASSVFLTCLEVFAIGTFCVLDSIFSMFITASMTAFFFAFTEVRLLKRNFFLLISGVSCGLAFLTKGFLAFVIAAIIFVPFSIWQHQLKKMIRLIWLPAIAAVFVILPWSIMIYLKEPDFWRYFFWVENIDRFVSPNGGQHPYPFWFFIPVVLIGILPWTFRMISDIFRLKKDLFNNPLIRFSICWFLFPFLFFSISKGKLITYILPCFPPLVIIFTLCLHQEFKTVITKRYNSSYKIGVILITIILIGFIITQIFISSTKIYKPNEFWKILFVIAGIFAYTVFLIKAVLSAGHERKFLFSCMAPVMLMFSIPFVIPERLIEKKAPVNFISQYNDRIDQNTILISDNYLTPAVCWCYQRSDVFLLNTPGEFSYGIKYDDSSKDRLINITQLQELISRDSADKNIILITRTKRYIEYKQKLPKPLIENIDCGFVFAEFAGGKRKI